MKWVVAILVAAAVLAAVATPSAADWPRPDPTPTPYPAWGRMEVVPPVVIDDAAYSIMAEYVVGALTVRNRADAEAVVTGTVYVNIAGKRHYGELSPLPLLVPPMGTATLTLTVKTGVYRLWTPIVELEAYALGTVEGVAIP